MDVADWLRTLGLERYEAAFRENGVSAEILRDLTADDLKDLGVTSIGHRRQLLVAIDQLRDDGMRSQAAEPSGDHQNSPAVDDGVRADRRNQPRRGAGIGGGGAAAERSSVGACGGEGL